MIKTILWDFDGVILDSMRIKGEGFKELFKKYDEKYLELIEKYHYENGGVSRFDKIKYFYNHILKKSISEEKVLKLAEEFGNIVKEKLLYKTNLIEDSVDFIKANYKKYNFHIVSGAEHKELNYLCDFFGLTKYFITISGSPVKKEYLVKNVLKKYNYEEKETILIGDAMTDYNAAIKNGICFYGYNNLELKEFDYIYSLSDFKP